MGGRMRTALRLARRRAVRIAAIVTAVLVVGGAGAAVAMSGDSDSPEAASAATVVEESPSPSSEPAESDSGGAEDAGGDSGGLVSLGGSGDDSSGTDGSSGTDETFGEDDTSSEDDTFGEDDSSGGTDSSGETGSDDSSSGTVGPAPLGSGKGVWWSPGGDAFTSSRLWTFDGWGHGSMKNFQQTGIDGPAQYPSDFTYESDGSDVRLSLGSVTSVANHEVVLSSLDYDSSADTLSLTVDGYSVTWYGCSSGGQAAVAAALCG